MSLPVEEKLERILRGTAVALEARDLEDALGTDRPIDGILARAAHAVLLRTLGPGAFLRGIVEISNDCRKNCLYCGLRRDNSALSRYSMGFDEITSALEAGWSMGIRSFLLQSGELLGETHLDLVAGVLRWAAGKWGDEPRMVLSLGELPREALEALRQAGAHRYLLRIETSDRVLYSRLHPGDGLHRFDARLACLDDLRKGGWQVGSGVLIGVPWQTAASLASDLEFLRERDVDMCGMGPWIEHGDTPLAGCRDLAPPREERVRLTLRMIALLRLLMPEINISATTALQTLDPQGLEKGLMHGANVFMPNLTPEGYRLDYNLYEGKTQVADDPGSVLSRLTARCSAVGRKVVLGEAGDSLHYLRRLPAGSAV